MCYSVSGYHTSEGNRASQVTSRGNRDRKVGLMARGNSLRSGSDADGEISHRVGNGLGELISRLIDGRYDKGMITRRGGIDEASAIAGHPWNQPAKLFALLDYFYPAAHGPGSRAVPFRPSYCSLQVLDSGFGLFRRRTRIIGINCRIRVRTAGPRMITIKAGNMKNTSGGTILTDVFALISSARWRRFVFAEGSRSLALTF